MPITGSGDLALSVTSCICSSRCPFWMLLPSLHVFVSLANNIYTTRLGFLAFCFLFSMKIPGLKLCHQSHPEEFHKVKFKFLSFPLYWIPVFAIIPSPPLLQGAQLQLFPPDRPRPSAILSLASSRYVSSAGFALTTLLVYLILFNK